MVWSEQNAFSDNILQKMNNTYLYQTIHMYSGITSGRVLDGELLYTKILEVNLFAFAYRLFHRDFSPINGAYWRHAFALCPVHISNGIISQPVIKCR